MSTIRFSEPFQVDLMPECYPKLMQFHHPAWSFPAHPKLGKYFSASFIFKDYPKTTFLKKLTRSQSTNGCWISTECFSIQRTGHAANLMRSEDVIQLSAVENASFFFFFEDSVINCIKICLDWQTDMSAWRESPFLSFFFSLSSAIWIIMEKGHSCI